MTTGGSATPPVDSLVVPVRESLGFTFILLLLLTRPSLARTWTINCGFFVAQTHFTLDCLVNLKTQSNGVASYSETFSSPASHKTAITWSSRASIIWPPNQQDLFTYCPWTQFTLFCLSAFDCELIFSLNILHLPLWLTSPSILKYLFRGWINFLITVRHYSPSGGCLQPLHIQVLSLTWTSVAISSCKILLKATSYVLLWNVYIFCLVLFMLKFVYVQLHWKQLQEEDRTNASISSGSGSRAGR